MNRPKDLQVENVETASKQENDNKSNVDLLFALRWQKSSVKKSIRTGGYIIFVLLLGALLIVLFLLLLTDNSDLIPDVVKYWPLPR